MAAMPGGGIHAGIEAERLAAVAERKQIGDQAAEAAIALSLERQRRPGRRREGRQRTRETDMGLLRRREAASIIWARGFEAQHGLAQ